jgi:hypothetical protein
LFEVPMSFEIVERYTRAVLFSSPTAADAKAAVVEAVKSRADLGGADLGGADLGGADLRRADLGGAYLRGADLRRADLGGAYLRGADLRGADLRGAYLRGAEGLLPDGITPLQIIGTRYVLVVRSVGHVTIGCEHHPIEWWEANYAATGRANNYSDAEIAEYRAHIQHAKQWMEAKGVLVAAATEGAQS